jgi:hypothetical protein
MADDVRSIPSVADGVKPGQRKLTWACFKRKLKREIKVKSSLYLRPKPLFHYPTARTTRWVHLRTRYVSPRRAESDDDNRQSCAGLRRENERNSTWPRPEQIQSQIQRNVRRADTLRADQDTTKCIPKQRPSMPPARLVHLEQAEECTGAVPKEIRALVPSLEREGGVKSWCFGHT